MANMSYCRFENTLDDLRDCYENMKDKVLSEREQKARQDLINLCDDIATEFSAEGEEDPGDGYEP